MGADRLEKGRYVAIMNMDGALHYPWKRPSLLIGELGRIIGHEKHHNTDYVDVLLPDMNVYAFSPKELMLTGDNEISISDFFRSLNDKPLELSSRGQIDDARKKALAAYERLEKADLAAEYSHKVHPPHTTTLNKPM